MLEATVRGPVQAGVAPPRPGSAHAPANLALLSAAGNRAMARALARPMGPVRGRGLTPDGAVRARLLQRTIGDGHDLSSPRFRGDEDLEACFDDEARLTMNGLGQAGARKVESGDGVRKVQEALVELGYLTAGDVTGTYTQATWDAVKRLKHDNSLGWEEMGDVGPGTMAFLDRRFAPNPTPPPPPPPPPTPPPAEERVCGPNVTGELARAWRSAQTRFDGLGFLQKLDNCRMLVQPIIHDSGGFHLNEDAFDTWGLFQNSASWTRIPPWHGSCNTPGSRGSHCRSRDPAHEATDVCSNTVQVGSDCWLTGTPNYGLFGVAMRRCHDFVSPLMFLPPPFNFAPETFGLANTMILAGAYKALKGDNVVGPERWVSATWLRGPSATASAGGIPEAGGARPRCSTTCPGPAPPTFSIVWEPHMPRTGMPHGPPYLPGPPACTP